MKNKIIYFLVKRFAPELLLTNYEYLIRMSKMRERLLEYKNQAKYWENRTKKAEQAFVDLSHNLKQKAYEINLGCRI